jgi:hypothetical protein
MSRSHSSNVSLWAITQILGMRGMKAELGLVSRVICVKDDMYLL